MCLSPALPRSSLIYLFLSSPVSPSQEEMMTDVIDDAMADPVSFLCLFPAFQSLSCRSLPRASFSVLWAECVVWAQPAQGEGYRSRRNV